MLNIKVSAHFSTNQNNLVIVQQINFKEKMYKSHTKLNFYVNVSSTLDSLSERHTENNTSLGM